MLSSWLGKLNWLFIAGRCIIQNNRPCWVAIQPTDCYTQPETQQAWCKFVIKLRKVCENSTWYLKACCNLYVSGCVQICMRIIINLLSDQIRATATISSFQASCPFIQLFLICQSKWRKKSRYEVTCKSSIENLLLQINSTALPFASSWCLCNTSQLYECSRMDDNLGLEL